MNIGQAANLSGLPAKTIRYYEDIKLVAPGRLDNGYRDYGEMEVHKLTFLQRARSLGFSIEDCRSLLALYEDSHRASADVKSIALARIGDIDRKVAELTAMRSMLTALAENCHGDERPDCPILEDLAGTKGREVI